MWQGCDILCVFFWLFGWNFILLHRSCKVQKDAKFSMIRFIIPCLLLFMMPLSLVAGSKKEQQAEIPAFLSDDQKARDYCNTVLSRSDEAYAQDTAIVNNILCDTQWIHSNMVITRYAILTTYCNKQLQQRREALQRTMPKGQLLSLSYREYGSSRPTTVEYALLRDADTGRWKLNGREVDETVATQIRTLVEQHKTYQCLDRYEEAPSFPQAPLLMGGLPSWEFICKFEGGTVVTGSECMPVPESCSAIVSYLRNLLK